MRAVVRYLLLFLGWNLLVSLVVVVGLATGYGYAGVAAMIVVYLAFIAYLVTRSGVPRDRWALLRLRPLDGPVLGWTLAAIPVLLLLSWAVGEVYVRLVPVPPENFNPFGPLMDSPAGRLSITILAVGMAPVLEEFFFRGLIQRTLERRFGAAAGILVASAIFAAVHVLPWVFPLHFFLGAAFGYAVWATGSIWTGVILHAANNAVAVAALGMQGEEAGPTPTLWEAGPDVQWWMTIAILIMSAAAAWIVAGGLRKASREARLRLYTRPG